MSDPTSNALFGADGTELSDSSSSGLTGWHDAPGLPPLSLPAIPNLSMTREAIAAALSADYHGSLEHGSFQHNHDTTPLPRPAVPPTSASPAIAPPTTAAPVRASVQHTRRLVAAAPPPTQPPTYGPGNARFRPPVAVGSSGGFSGGSGGGASGGSSTAGQFGGFRRRISLPTPRLALPGSSDGGAAVFFLIASVIALVLTYGIIMGIVDSLASLFQ